jgi:hypothetical protein
MINTGKLKVSASGDREIVMTRSFNAPPRLVFDAFTKPELVRQWLLGPDGWSMPVCEIDLRVGGNIASGAAIVMAKWPDGRCLSGSPHRADRLHREIWKVVVSR